MSNYQAHQMIQLRKEAHLELVAHQMIQLWKVAHLELGDCSGVGVADLEVMVAEHRKQL